jgi:hypothetical protein
MNLIFGHEGADTWTDARSFNEKDGNPNQRWITSVERVCNIAKPILMNGGNVWVMEAGQSHITRDWIEALQANGISQDICKARIFVVQHSNWNHTHNRNEDLEFLKENAEYIGPYGMKQTGSLRKWVLMKNGQVFPKVDSISLTRPRHGGSWNWETK